jgi:RimJ/RimL family protein N-acetyltransferase
VQLAPAYPVRTSRLLVRPLSTVDTDALLAYRSRAEVCRFVPFEPMTEHDVTEKLRGSWSRTTIDAESQSLTLGVELAASGALIGDVILMLHSERHRGGEIGWVFHPEAAGHDYATEASHALLHLAFDCLGLHRVIARVVVGNDASLRVGARLGMRQEAHLVRNEWFKGRWIDEIDLAILEDEWATQHRNGTHRCP